MAFIEAIATVVPEHQYAQEKIAAFARQAFPELMASYANVFEHARIETRYLARPLEYYLEGHSFHDRNADSVEQACLLAQRVCLDLSLKTKIDVQNFHQLLAVNTTTLATPSLDALLFHKMGLNPKVRRTPIFGTGCVGGAIGLSRASAHARAFPQENTVLLNVELCGHTFKPEDKSLKNLVGTSLFGDGASAVLLRGIKSNKAMCDIVATGSYLFPKSTHIMGWDFTETGLTLILARELPALVAKQFRVVVEEFLGSQNLTFKDIAHYAIHPGGPRVLEAVQKALGLADEHLEASWRHLKNYGNMSSVSIIFILDDVFKSRRPKAGELGLLMAMGPGFSAEFVLLKFC